MSERAPLPSSDRSEVATGTQADLERFAMSASYGRLTGVAVACHAIADGFLLLHAGVGCKDKVTHLLAHDWEQHCNLRQGWTEVGDQSLITGAAARIGPYVRSWQQRMGSALVCVVPATFLEMTGEDLAAEVRSADAEADATVLLVRAPGHDGDEFDGYASLCRAVVEQADWGRSDRRRGEVTLLGYWFDRYEGDHLGNLSQLATMLKALGLRLGPVLLSGTPYRETLEAGRSEVIAELPYLAPARDALDPLWRSAGRQPVRVDLPMGFAGTRRWLHGVTAPAAVDPRLVDAYADKRESRARAPLGKLRARWRSRRVAVLAEAPLAAGYCSMLIELGLSPVLVGLRSSRLGGRAELERILAADGLFLPADAVVLEGPSLAALRATLLDQLRARRIDGVLGSATELNLLGQLDPAELALPTSGGQPARGPFVLEIGFPCWHYHAVQQMPFMGYGGMVTLAQRLIDPPRLLDAARGAVR
jgi:nitrogenase molybdenum-iron protein alpha/beta subunit